MGSMGVDCGYIQKRGVASIDPLDPKMPKMPKITKNGTFGQIHPVWTPWDPPPGDPKMGHFWTPFWDPYFGVGRLPEGKIAHRGSKRGSQNDPKMGQK